MDRLERGTECLVNSRNHTCLRRRNSLCNPLQKKAGATSHESSHEALGKKTNLIGGIFRNSENLKSKSSGVRCEGRGNCWRIAPMVSTGAGTLLGGYYWSEDTSL